MKKTRAQLNSAQVNVEKSKSTNWMYWFLGLLTFFIFANSISNGYNLDDEIVTRNHPLTAQGIKAISEIFTSSYYKDDMGYAYGYRPMVHVSFAIEYELFGEKPEVSHFFNVVLYAFTVLLFFRFLHKLLGEKYLPLITLAVLFFAIHPIHSEVVASLKNRDELLGFLFAMASGNWLLRFIQKNNNWISLFLAILFLLLAMLSKKSIYPFVFIFPLAISLFSSISWRTFFLILIALIVPAAIVASELVFNRFAILSIFPVLFGIFSFYILRLIKEKSMNTLLTETSQNKYFLIGSIVLILLFTAYLKNQWLTFLVIPFFFLLIKNYRILGVGVFSLSCLFLHVLFHQFEYALLSVIFPAFLLFQQLKERDLHRHLLLFNILILTTAISLETYKGGFDWGVFARYFALYFFLFLRNYRSWLAIVFVPLVICIAHIVFGAFENGNVNFFLVSLAIIAAHDALTTIKKTEFYNALLIILCFIGFLIPLLRHYQSLPVQNTYNTVEKLEIYQSDVQSKAEGRALDYVENTLIAPHSNLETIATGLNTLGEYIRLMIFPNELSFYYGFAKIKTTDFTDWKVWFCLLIHLGLIVLALWKIRHQPLFSFGVFWYFVSILLFSNWVELVAGMVGERLAFTASAGFCIFFAGIIFWLKPNFNWKKPKWLEWSLLIILLLFVGRTIHRNADWKDPITLMSHDIKHLANSAQANNLYAIKLMNASYEDSDVSDLDKLEYRKSAVHHFNKAVEIYPKFSNAWFDLGRSALSVGDTNTATKGFLKSIDLNPTFPDSYFNLIQIYDSQKKWKDYKSIAKKLFIQVKEPNTYIILAKANLENGNKSEAKEILHKGLLSFPKNNDLTFCLSDLIQNH
jgi:hypothetical protein